MGNRPDMSRGGPQSPVDALHILATTRSSCSQATTTFPFAATCTCGLTAEVPDGERVLTSPMTPRGSTDCLDLPTAAGSAGLCGVQAHPGEGCVPVVVEADIRRLVNVLDRKVCRIPRDPPVQRGQRAGSIAGRRRSRASRRKPQTEPQGKSKSIRNAVHAIRQISDAFPSRPRYGQPRCGASVVLRAMRYP